MNGNPIQKIYTVADIQKRVLSRLGIEEPDDNLKPKIIAEANAQQKNIYLKITTENPDLKELYKTSCTFSFVSGEQTFEVIEVTNPLIKEIRTIEIFTSDGKYFGTMPSLNPEGFKNLSSYSWFDNSVIHTVEGRRIKIFVGSNVDVTGMTYKLWYIREVNTISGLIDLMDIPSDRFDELCLAIANTLQPSIKKVEPESNG